MRFLPIVVVLMLAAAIPASAQISPPGLDDTKAAFWAALGASQQINSRWSVTAYIGASRKSNPDNYSPFHKPAIFVLNEETNYKINSRWMIGLCTSYRLQNRYDKEFPDLNADPSIQKEARYYLRFYYQNHIGKVAMKYSFRPEYRRFYYEGLTAAVPEELRFRLKIQASFHVGNSESNQIVLANEWLTAVDHVRTSGEMKWDSYHYTEDRFTTYFRHSIKKPSCFVDIGFMHQIKHDGRYIIQAAVDLIFQNPFGYSK